MKWVQKVEEGCIMPNGISYCLNKRVGKLWALKIPIPFLKRTQYSYMEAKEVPHSAYLVWATARGVRIYWSEL